MKVCLMRLSLESQYLSKKQAHLSVNAPPSVTRVKPKGMLMKPRPILRARAVAWTRIVAKES